MKAAPSPCGLTHPYKGWGERATSSCHGAVTEGALSPGGNESRGRLLPVDTPPPHLPHPTPPGDTLDFKEELCDCTTVQGF